MNLYDKKLLLFNQMIECRHYEADQFGKLLAKVETLLTPADIPLLENLVRAQTIARNAEEKWLVAIGEFPDLSDTTAEDLQGEVNRKLKEMPECPPRPAGPRARGRG